MRKVYYIVIGFFVWVPLGINCGGVPSSTIPGDEGSIPTVEESGQDNPATRPLPGFGNLRIMGTIDSDILAIAESSDGDMVITESNDMGDFILDIVADDYYTVRFDNNGLRSVLTFDATGDGDKQTSVFYAATNVSEVDVGSVELDFDEEKAYPSTNPLTILDSDNDGQKDIDDPDRQSEDLEEVALIEEEGISATSAIEDTAEDTTSSSEEVASAENTASSSEETQSQPENTPSTETATTETTTETETATTETETATTETAATTTEATTATETTTATEATTTTETTTNPSSDGQQTADQTSNDGENDQTETENTEEKVVPVVEEEEVDEIQVAIDHLIDLRDEVNTIEGEIKDVWKEIQAFSKLGRKLTSEEKQKRKELQQELSQLKTERKELKAEFRTEFKEAVTTIKGFRKTWKIVIKELKMD